MNLAVMKSYCDLVETASFSRTAEANFISQSAVSQQLARVEHEIGTQLISRGRGPVVATEAGKTFYRGLKEILRRYERLLGEVRSASDAIRGVLRVGTIYSVGFYMLDAYIRKFLQAHPEVNLHVEYTHWNRIYAAVLSGEMDLGVVAFPEQQRSIEIIPLASESLVLVCSPKHRLAGRKKVKPAELKDEKFIGFVENVPTRRYIDKVLKRLQAPVQIVMEFDNVELVKRAVEVGCGLSILPPGTVRREVKYGDLCCVALDGSDEWKRDLCIVHRRGKTLSPAEKMFLSPLKKKA